MTQLRLRRLLIFVSVITIVVGFLADFQALAAGQSDAARSPAPKYIFIFLADGAGIAHLELADLYSEQTRKKRLLIADTIMKEGFVGFLTTHSADSLVTDSAAAATALASGCKARNGMLGICADGRVPKTVMESAKEKGMRIGLATNAAIYDASPAAFVCHVSKRKEYQSIVEQYLKLAPDLLLGGGRDLFLRRDRSEKGGSLLDRFKADGYAYVSTARELADIKSTRVLGLFSSHDMSFEVHRNKEVEPSVYDMTKAAIRTLQQDNANGFVAFIESESIDSAAHQGNAAAVVHDFIEFDRAVGLAYDFYQKNPTETLLLIASDHETGGLALVSKRINIPGSSDPLSHLLGWERAQGVTISWGTSGHTSQPVPVIALGVGAERFRGYQDNTDFAKQLFALLEPQ